MGAIDVRPAESRFHTRLPWLDSRHCFSFSRHYDPTNISHGLLLVSNDDVVLGEATLEGAGALGAGDSVRLTAAGDLALAAGPDGAEVLVWETA